MKIIHIYISIIIFLGACQSTKKENSETEKSKTTCQEELAVKYKNATKKYKIENNFDNELKLQPLDSITIQDCFGAFEITIDATTKTFWDIVGERAFISNYTDGKEAILISVISENSIGRDLYFFTFSKENKKAHAFFVGDGSYEEFQFISYLHGIEERKGNYQFNQVTSTFEFEEGEDLSTQQYYYMNKDSIVFNINVDEQGVITKNNLDSVRIRTRIDEN